jgi:hypothetical protein
VPRGTATISYNPAAFTTSVQATIQISAVGLTGPVIQAHVHAQSPNGFNSGVIVPLCAPCSTIGTPAGQTFENVAIPLPFFSSGNAYINVHTDAHPGGEVRGQLMSFITPPAALPAPTAPAPASSLSTVTFALSSYQEAVASSVTLPVTASIAQQIFDLVDGTCAPPDGWLGPIPTGTSTFNVVFTPQGTISFSAIQMTALSSTLLQAHIHGPCVTGTRCNAGVVYHICGTSLSPQCPTTVLGSATIPAFTVNVSQSTNSELALIYHKALSGSVFYYVNFHTTNFPDGEHRGDLILPQGSVSVVFDPAVVPTRSTLQSFNQVLTIPATVTISVSGVTAAPSAIHLHEPATFTNNAGVLVPICGPPLVGQPCNAFTSIGGTQTFQSVALPIRLLNGNLPSLGAVPYWNVHTQTNPNGEVRGRAAQFEDTPSTQSAFSRAAIIYYEDAACTRLSFNVQRQNSATSSPMATPSGLPNPFIFPVNQCIPSPLLPNVWERVLFNGCDVDSVRVISYRDSRCTQIRRVASFSRQCAPVTVNGVPLFARATCTLDSAPAPAPALVRRPYMSTVSLNVLQLHPGPISFAYTATASQQPPPAFVSSCARATFSMNFGADRSISFSDIVFTGLSSNLNAAHIHGPCPLPAGSIGSEEGFAPCEAPAIFGICGAGNCPTGLAPTIPRLTVDKTRPFGDTDASLLIGLYESILSGDNLYYVNFHTDRCIFP